ncbi:VOC family protein [Svornostia abyssi]|uniref:VOC family protein n=1 Tax=Svornostia abyssi TaxID=2898438 RepID=A0ABY5PLI4_9ACTN|nr:VOC family protein [Parviterribacteraceae bacterium J379]
MRLEGIHHVTAITGDAPANVAFYTGVLGLRLVAKSVNQDDPRVYHLFYSDEVGSAGADITFFEYPGAPRGRAGGGMVHRIVWRVASAAAIDFWEERLSTLEDAEVIRDGDALAFSDPEGLRHELTVSDADGTLSARHPEIPAEHALRGFDGVRMYSMRPAQSARMLTELMGAEDLGGNVFELRGERRGGTVAFDPPPAARGLQGGGTVHHVALGTTAAEHPAWETHLRGAGVQTSGIVDRHYFHSIYYREPGGILYEIADDAPGFTVDGPVEELGTKIILPPWYEPERAEIERALTPLPDPRAGWDG